MEDIELNKVNRTWCGYPHKVSVIQCTMSTLLLNYRSGNFKPEEDGLGGKLFVLMAVVTSTQHDVTTGSDGIEHMYVFRSKFKNIKLPIKLKGSGLVNAVTKISCPYIT